MAPISCSGSKRGEGAGEEGRTASRRARVRERYWRGGLASTVASLSVTLEKSGSAELFVDAEGGPGGSARGMSTCMGS